MRIDELFEDAGRPVFSFEFFPPKTDEGARKLNEALEALGPLTPDFVSVTYGAGGSTRDTTIDIVKGIRAFGLEAMAHLTCVNATVGDLRVTLEQMDEAGIENVLALRGDPPRGQTDWKATEGGFEYSHELVGLLRDEFPGFAVGAAAFPETHIHAVSPEEDMRFLKAKVDAGAQFLITQMFFDDRFYFDFVDRARAIGIDVPILPGVMPILSSSGIKRMTELSAAKLPPGLVRELDARMGDDEAVAELGVSYATLQCSDLLAGGAPGIHFLTLNRSPATRAILSALKVFEPWRAPATA